VLLLLLAHVGYTTGAVGISQKFALRRPLDHRLVVLMAILPDVIDRALYAFVIPGAEGGRLFAHTLLFNLVLLAVLVAIRRDLWIYGVLPIVHLLLDLQGMSAEELFWPFLGADLSNVQIPGGLGETAGQPYGERVGDRIEDVFSTYSGARELRVSRAASQAGPGEGGRRLLVSTRSGIYKSIGLHSGKGEGSTSATAIPARRRARR